MGKYMYCRSMRLMKAIYFPTWVAIIAWQFAIRTVEDNDDGDINKNKWTSNIFNVARIGHFDMLFPRIHRNRRRSGE